MKKQWMYPALALALALGLSACGGNRDAYGANGYQGEYRTGTNQEYGAGYGNAYNDNAGHGSTYNNANLNGSGGSVMGDVRSAMDDAGRAVRNGVDEMF